MKSATKISFKLKENGNGYGHFFAEFGEGEKKAVTEIGMVCGCQNREMAATVIAILESYKEMEVADCKVDIITAESVMRNAIDRFETLKKKDILRKEEDV